MKRLFFLLVCWLSVAIFSCSSNGAKNYAARTQTNLITKVESKDSIKHTESKETFIPPLGGWTEFWGHVNNKEMEIWFYFFDNGDVKGSYADENCEYKIQLVGKFNNDSTLTLTEYAKGKISAYYSGKIHQGDFLTYQGSWYDSTRKNANQFKLQCIERNFGSFENRYRMHFTNDEVENFMLQVKNAIINDDKEWIASHIKYPIRTRINKKFIVLKSKEQLIVNYDKIFPKKFIDYIKLQCPLNLSQAGDGTMLGGGKGVIYIEEFKLKKENYIVYIWGIAFDNN